MKFIKLDEIEVLSESQINKIYKRHYNGGLYKLFKYLGIDIEFVKASGMYVYDSSGREYLDYLGGFGALNLGHNDPRVLEAINKYKYRPNMLQLSKNSFAAVLANNISYLTDDELSYSYFTNSGTETVEEAIKLARLYKKGGSIIYFSKAYHGKTLGAISALGNKIKQKYRPLVPNFIEVPFGDIEAIKEITKKLKVAAVLCEPIQGEAGIIVPPVNFYKELRKLCDKKNIVFIMDEIQTGLGRCGTNFCYQQFGIIPDVMCLSKSLSGGIIPIGAVVVEESLWMDTYGKFKNATLINSTFSGNTMACTAAMKTLEIINNEHFAERANKMGAYALTRIKELMKKHKIIKSVRGRGLLIGIELDNLNRTIPDNIMEAFTSNIVAKLMNEYSIISGITLNNPSVLRFEPPLIVNKGQIDYYVNCLDKVLEDRDSIFKLARRSVKNIGVNMIK